MAHLKCDKCGSGDTNAFGSWNTPIKILCKKCGNKKRYETIKEQPKDNEIYCL
jgi:ribosomal protein L37E